MDETLPLASARARKEESLLDATWLSVPRKEPEPPVEEEKKAGAGWKKMAVAAVLLIGIAAAGFLWRSRASAPEPESVPQQVQVPAPGTVTASLPIVPTVESPDPAPVATTPESTPTPAPVRPREIAPEDAVTVGEAAPPMRRGDLVLRGLPNVVEPEPRDFPAYSYPAAARGSGKAARVRVRVLVDEEGRVIEASLREADGSGLGFDEVALETARKTPFHPATRDDIPGRMWTELIFEFSE